MSFVFVWTKILPRKENQRTLPFNVEIRNLPQPKTVFRGSSSELGQIFVSECVLFSVERKLLNICEKYFFLNMLNSLQATTQCMGLRCSFRALLVPSSSPSTFPPPCSSPCPGWPSSSPPTSCPPGLSSSSLSVSSSSTCSTPRREHSSQEES